MPQTERQAERIQPFVAPCRYVAGDDRHPGFVTDISTRGCRVNTDVEPPAKETVIAIEVRLPRRPIHLSIPGTVRWSRANPRGGFVFGVSFDGIGAAEQQAVNDVVDEFRRRAAAIG